MELVAMVLRRDAEGGKEEAFFMHTWFHNGAGGGDCVGRDGGCTLPPARVQFPKTTVGLYGRTQSIE